MTKKNESVFLSGFPKYLTDILILFRFARALTKSYGLRGISLLFKYIQHPKNLFGDLPNRYVRRDKDLFVVPDVPPLNSKAFIQYLRGDVDVLLMNKPAPLLFGIVCISSVCPYKCSYCYNIDEHTNKQHLSDEVIMEAVETFLKNGARNIYLSGGEPMMRADLITLLLEKYASSNTGFWLITTGWGLNEDKLRAFKTLGLRGVMITLDTSDASYVDDVKGAGAFDKALFAIKTAGKVGLLVVADCVMSRHLLEEKNFEAYTAFACASGVHFINCYAPRTKAGSIDDALSNFTLDELLKIGTLARLNQTDKRFRNSSIAYSPDNFEAKRGCMGGRLFFYISPSGHVKACPFQKSVLGNINTLSLDEIISQFHKQGCREVCLTNKMLAALTIDGKMD